MRLKAFSVFDGAANAYISPFFVPTVGVAQRAFTQAVRDPSHSYSRSPADYTLFEIGSFDDATGMLEHLPSHVRVCAGNEVVGSAVALN